MTEVLLDILLFIIGLVFAVFLGDLIAIGPYKKVEPKNSEAGDPWQKTIQGIQEGARIIRLVRTPSFVEQQEGPSCGGFAAAYALRHFGVDAHGMDIYKAMFKMPRGYVQVREVIKALKKQGIKATYCKGSLETIKEEIDRGYPVILMVRTKPGSWEFHFSVAVGYDKDNMYVADSAYSPRPAKLKAFGERPPFNRIIPNEHFLKIWNTATFFMPTYKYTYLTLRRDNTPNSGL